MSELGSLYYPYHPSDGGWLRHALLYFDFIGTTVPSSLEDQIDACALPPHLRQLRDAGLYRSLTDSIGLRPVASWLSQLDSAFAFAAVPLAEDLAIMTFMNQAFIAKDKHTGEEVKLADFLAEAVTTLSGEPIVPSTDEPRAFNHLYGHDPKADAVKIAHSAYLTYHRLLPTPRPDTAIPRLLKFREKYRDERMRLQSALALARKKLGENFEPSHHISTSQ